jgi:parvulin-like peptidyl-prolyl isomerase
MSFRARPTSTRGRTWDDRDRRSMLLNLGFGVIVALAVILLLVAFGVSWYNDHLASAATVNGQSISRDAFRTQYAINAFRIDYQGRRVRTLLTAGHIRTADAEARQSVLQQRSQQNATISLEQLVDGAVMAQLAAQQNVTVTDADIDAQMTEDATTPEMRHAWLIAVDPELAEGETEPSDEAKAAARAKAEQALADLRAGKDWTTVAMSVSTDATKGQGGDLGYIDENAALDQPFLDATMAATKDTPTDVVEGADGTYRVGRVTDIVAPMVDATYQTQVTDAGIAVADYREAVRRDVLRTKLGDAVLAGYLAAGPQRDVAEIRLGVDVDPSTGSPTGKEAEPDAVKIRHILYSPNRDPSAAASLAPDDAAWAEAETKANAAYEKLKADPSLFASLVASDSDDAGSADRGGSYWFTPDDSLLPEFHDAIFASGLTPGQLLPPVKTTAGYHVIQIEHFPTDLEWAGTLKQQIEAGTLPFADAARDNSDGTTAGQGGDIGWVAKGQLDPKVEAAIYAAPIGKVSDPVAIDGDGVYLFLVSQEQTREPDATQKAALESSAFSTWYSAQKGGFDISRDPAITASTSS